VLKRAQIFKLTIVHRSGLFLQLIKFKILQA
jgi:hypothetical protein